MFQNYLKIALRNLWKNKPYLFINLLGLSVAFGVSTLLILTAYDQLTFDTFHTQNGPVYRVYEKVVRAESVEYGNSMPLPMAPSLKADMPDVKHIARVLDGGAQILKDGKLINQGIVYTDPDYFKVFGFKLLKGNANSVLGELSNVVLREDVAEKLFGNEDPMGKTIILSYGAQNHSYIVSGIVEKGPDNQSVENDVLVRIENYSDYADQKDRWDASQHQLYLKLHDNVAQATFERKLKAFTKKYELGAIKQLIKEGAKPDERGEVLSTRVMNLPEAYFDNNVGGRRSINRLYPIMLLVIAGVILLIATINFINLSIAKSFARAKEVGMRKALGALKEQVIGQFWGEALLICVLAFGLGLLLTYLLLPQYNAMFKSVLTLSALTKPTIALSLLAAFGVVALLAGGYPAWAVARFNTIEVLKGKVKVSSRSGGIRNTLIVFQFTMAVLLMACTIIVWTQMRYLRQKPLGFDVAQVYSVPVGSEIEGRKMLQFFRTRLANQPRILSMTGSDFNLGRGKDGSAGKSVLGFQMGDRSIQTNMRTGDYDYVKTLGLKLIAGREFSPEYATDTTQAVIINETMAKQLNVKDPIGVTLNTDGNPKVIGVVKDFHFESLHRGIESMTVFMKGFGVFYIFVKIAPDHTDETIALLEKTYNEIAPKSEFNGSFLDENLENQYQREQRLSKMFFSGATLAIILSCLGLFAIALMVIGQRTKEIGIRKALGASVFSITALLSKDFLKMVLVAIVLASPLAWWAMDKWLADFAYRTPIHWWVFVVTAILAVMIALLTVSFQAIRAALMNPTRSLRTE
ncbi:MAG: ABC transporter permease [Spirosomaceae bacterium]|nr:ABC transporter permease [Spirosomataceae bacterium]